MPLYTRGSQASVTMHGRSGEFWPSPDTFHRSPMRSFRVLPSYPSPCKRKVLSTNASTSSFRTSYVMKEESDSESDVSTITSISEKFIKRTLLAKGHFEIESPDSASIKSETISNFGSYTCEERLLRPYQPEKALSKFVCEGTGAISCIAAVRLGQAWICKNNNKLIHLYHKNGHRKETRTLSVRLEVVCSRQDGTLLTIPHLSQAIHKLGPTGKLTRFVGFELAPAGIRSTSRNETIVTTAPIKKSQKRGPRPRKTPSVMRLAHTGEVIWDIKAKGTEQFVDPSRVSVNRNGDICVIDHEPNRAQVVLLSPDGDMKRCYYGVQSKELCSPFDPKDVCCDRKGRIYVADLHSSAIHVLDKQANFVDFLVTKKDGILYPTALACDTEGCVWVGFSSGEIRVYEVERLLKH